MNHCTTGTILKRKDKTMEQVISSMQMHYTLSNKKHGKVIKKMEKLAMLGLKISISVLGAIKLYSHPREDFVFPLT